MKSVVSWVVLAGITVVILLTAIQFAGELKEGTAVSAADGRYAPAATPARNDAVEAATAAALKRKEAELTAEVARLTTERDAMKARLAALEKLAQAAEAARAAAAAAPTAGAAAGGTPAPAEAAKPEAPTRESVAAAFGAIAEEGVFAYGGEGMKKVIAGVKALGKEGLELMASQLKDGASSAARFLAAAILEGVGDPAAVPALELALKSDADALVRRMASHAMAVMHPDEALNALDDAMRHDADWGVRANSAYGLAKAGRQEGVEGLVKFYQDPTVDAATKPAILGGLMDVAAPSTAPIFRALLKEKQEIGFHLMAIKALEKMKDVDSLTELRVLINDPQVDGSVKAAAKGAYNAISGQVEYK
ncbi:MAG: HEAT repeat domain-containing protein [Planctomycetes bacterium]|nr:HEAT repeat domain-containing protein [Planctomycetota bacterium]